MRRLLLSFLLIFAPLVALAQPAGDCSSEATLQGRTDILFCEPWSSATWYSDHGYKDDGEKTSPDPASGPDQTSVQANCFSGGPCLRVRCRAYTDGGCGGMLAHHWPIPGTQQEVYLRYYIRMSSNWSTENYCGDPSCIPSGSIGENTTSGGKWPGLADTRTNADPSGQCGNGGAYSDGINCWSGRLRYRNCIGSGGADICTAGGLETTRLGWYWYLPPASGANNQMFAAFDNRAWGTDMAGAGGTCASDPLNVGSTDSDATSCGKGAAGLVNGVWYRVELRIKMNTPGTANGIAEAYITKAGDTTHTLRYRKTNVKFREVGHDNLHVRTVWLDVHMGGEFNGPLTESYIELARMVVATKGLIGAFKPSGGPYTSNSFSVSVATSNPFSGLAGGQWQELPNTTIRSVIPSGPSGNPDAIVDAYSGGTIDTLRHRFIIWGGGHSDYSGSEVYAINLANSTVARIVESSSNPISRHTYGAMAYVAHTDQVYSSGGGTWPNGNVDNTTWLLNLSAGPPPTWTHDTDTNPMQLSYGTISRYDSVTQKVYIYDRDDLYTYNPSTGAYSGILQTGPHFTLDASGVIDTVRRRLEIGRAHV